MENMIIPELERYLISRLIIDTKEIQRLLEADSDGDYTFESHELEAAICILEKLEGKY